MCDALKTNTTLTKLDLKSEGKRNNTQIAFINQNTLSILIKSTDNKIGDTEATSLSDALKTNTTLTKLDLKSEGKRNNTKIALVNQPTPSILTKSTDNIIGDKGATSMGEALKTNTTLTQIELRGEDKRNNTQIASINKPLFSINIKSIENRIGERGATSLFYALKSNTALTKLDLKSEHKRNNTQMASISNPLFSILIQSTDNNIGDAGATSLSDALKSNTTLTKLNLWS